MIQFTIFAIQTETPFHIDLRSTENLKLSVWFSGPLKEIRLNLVSQTEIRMLFQNISSSCGLFAISAKKKFVLLFIAITLFLMGSVLPIGRKLPVFLLSALESLTLRKIGEENVVFHMALFESLQRIETYLVFLRSTWQN
ncbi:hypothetical protein A3A68_02450 [Candidatus Saccharibacteria bacterium RIFCSPLOWO2_01_FULL_48_13]|nr:MAG: hypothetical protein A3A68_02450 [Candidatus Saccharibacteria bacterium RIFCSPLOWO2_01_FULL_48_13]